MDCATTTFLSYFEKKNRFDGGVYNGSRTMNVNSCNNTTLNKLSWLMFSVSIHDVQRVSSSFIKIIQKQHMHRICDNGCFCLQLILLYIVTWKLQGLFVNLCNINGINNQPTLCMHIALIYIRRTIVHVDQHTPLQFQCWHIGKTWVGFDQNSGAACADKHRWCRVGNYYAVRFLLIILRALFWVYRIVWNCALGLGLII